MKSYRDRNVSNHIVPCHRVRIHDRDVQLRVNARRVEFDLVPQRVESLRFNVLGSIQQYLALKDASPISITAIVESRNSRGNAQNYVVSYCNAITKQNARRAVTNRFVVLADHQVRIRFLALREGIILRGKLDARQFGDGEFDLNGAGVTDGGKGGARGKRQQNV